MQAEIRICVGSPPSCDNCIVRRVGGFTIAAQCIEGDCGDVLNKVLESLREDEVRKLQVICRGAGGCVEVMLRDGELCCPTRLRDMPGISSLIDSLREREVSVEVTRGSITICARIGDNLKQCVEKIRDAFLLLDSVYDMQRRIAEGVAKSIRLVGQRKGQGENAKK